MDMKEQLESFPFQIKEALKINYRIDPDKYDRLVIVGMGGSGLAGSLFEDFICDKINTPVLVCKNYLPSLTNKSLVMVFSYSGNTWETIKLYNEAKKKTKNIVCFASGGKLFGKEDFVHIPEGFSPRESVIFMLSALLVVIGRKKDVKVFDSLKKLDKNYAKGLAKKLKGRIPVIYSGSERFESVAYKWKIDFNETSKMFSHSGYFTEVLHNELEAEFPKNVKILVLLDKKKNYLNKSKKFFKFEEIEMKGKTDLEKIYYGVALGDYVAYYLALMRNKNPVVVSRIEKFKRLMKGGK